MSVYRPISHRHTLVQIVWNWQPQNWKTLERYRFEETNPASVLRSSPLLEKANFELGHRRTLHLSLAALSLALCAKRYLLLISFSFVFSVPFLRFIVFILAPISDRALQLCDWPISLLHSSFLSFDYVSFFCVEQPIFSTY